MPNITIRDLPEEVLNAIKQKATANRRSINSEILCGLESIFGNPQQNKRTFLAKVRQIRGEVNREIYLTEEELERAKARPAHAESSSASFLAQNEGRV